MPEINAFVNWARSVGNGNALAAVREGANRSPSVVRLSSVKNPFARLVGTADAVARRDAAVESFRNALVERYGETIATLAFEHARPSGCVRGLSAHQVTAADEMARRLEDQCKALRNDGLLKPPNDLGGNGPDAANQIRDKVLGPLLPNEREGVRSFLVSYANALQLLGMTPAGTHELETFRKQCQRAFAGLDKAAGHAEEMASLGKADALRRRIVSLKAELAEHQSHLEDLVAHAPAGAQALENMARTWKEALCEAAETRAQGAAEANRTQAQAAVDEIKALKDAFFVETLKTKKTGMGKTLGKLLNDVFAAHGVGKRILKGSGTGQVVAAFGNVLNRRDWKPIEKQFSALVGGQSVTLKSTIVSGRHIEPTLANGVMVNTQKVGGYEKGVNAYNSHSTASGNAVNLATTKVEIADADGKSVTAFSGVRHAVNSAWGLKGEDRENASVARSVQCVHAALVSYLERHPDTDPKAVLKLPMTSVALLNPDFARHVLPRLRKRGRDERLMMEEQHKGWNTLCKLEKPLELKVGDQVYRVKPDIIMFNYGVNKFSTGKLGGTELTAGWNAANELNFESLKALSGRVLDYLRANLNDPNREAINTLVRQIDDIVAKGDEAHEKHDAFKVGVRISVLSYLIGGVPCWNCKSGKDRTGQMDVECKFLATLVARGLPIPEPGARLTPEQRELLRTIALEGGNPEVQEYNTGLAGSKVYDEASVQERLGGSPETVAAFKGGVSYVKF